MHRTWTDARRGGVGRVDTDPGTPIELGAAGTVRLTLSCTTAQALRVELVDLRTGSTLATRDADGPMVALEAALTRRSPLLARTSIGGLGFGDLDRRALLARMRNAASLGEKYGLEATSVADARDASLAAYDVASGAELDMVALQRLVSQRQAAIQLATGLMRGMNEAQKDVARNLAAR